MLKSVNCSPEVIDKVVVAIQTIMQGVCKRVDVNENVKVYEVKNVIRVDFKVKEK